MRHKSSNPFPLWECASQVRLCSSCFLKNPKRSQAKTPVRLKSLLVTKKFYTSKLLLILGGSRTKEAMLGKDSCWRRGTISWGDNSTFCISKQMPKDLPQTCLYLFLTYDGYLQAITDNFPAMIYLSPEDTLMSPSESGPSTGIWSVAAGLTSCPRKGLRNQDYSIKMNSLLFQDWKNLHTVMKGYKSSSVKYVVGNCSQLSMEFLKELN